MKEKRTGFFRSINGKMQLVFSGIFIVVIVGIGAGIFVSLSTGFEAQYREQLQSTTNLIYQMIDEYVNTAVRNYLIGVAQTTEKMVAYEYQKYLDGKETEDQAFANVKKLILNPAFGKIGETGYIAGVSDKGILVIHPDTPGADASSYPFMQKAMAMKNGYLEYMWKNPGDKTARAKAAGLSYFAPWHLIVWASSYKSEFSSLVNLTDLGKRILSIKIGKHGFAYVLDDKGNALIHPTKQGQNLYDARSAGGQYYVQEMLKKKNGSIEYTMTGKDAGKQAIAYFRTYPDLNLLIVSKVYKEDIYGLIDKVRDVSLLVALLAFIILNILVALVISRILRPVEMMKQVTARVAEGDLTTRVEKISRDEIGQMSVKFNDLIDAVENMLRQMKGASADLFAAVQDLSVSSQEITTTSNQQAAAVKEIVSTMEDSDQLSKSIATRVGEVTKISQATKEVVETGFSTVRGSLEKMDEIKSSNSDTISGIKSLGERIESIWEIVNIINSIADQTKIIAFNAELEASAAGDAGKNFQIVATEIRRLADSTVASTNEIKTKINEIQHSSDNLIMASEQGTQRIREGGELSSKLKQIFEDILSSSDISAKSAEQIATSINQQVSAFEQILLALKQISEGTDNFVVSTKSTAHSSERLSNMAQEMKSLVDAYQVREDG